MILPVAPALILAIATLSPGPSNWSHTLDVTLDPGSGSLRVVDRVVTGTGAGERLRFELHPGLRVTGFSIAGKDRLAELRRDTGGAAGLASWEGPGVFAGAQVVIRYEGILPGPAGDLLLLEPRSGWVPLFPEAGEGPARYDLTTRVPERWRAVTVGRAAVDPRPARGWTVTRWRSERPTGAPALAAGPFRVRSSEQGGIRISVHTLDDDETLAGRLIQRARAVVDRLSARLLSTPWPKLDIVEGPAPGTRGYPSFVVAGREALATAPSSLERAIAEAWWRGYFEPSRGEEDFLEGLGLFTGELPARETEGPGPAAAHRRALLAEGSAGARGAMILHMLGRLCGEEPLFAALRTMSGRQAGLAGWSDLREALEGAAGLDLARFFSEWPGRPGLPSFRFGELRAERVEGRRHRVSGEILQQADDGAPRALSLPIEVATARERRRVEVAVDGAVTPFSVEVEGAPVEAAIDPDADVAAREVSPPRPLLRDVTPAASSPVEMGAGIEEAIRTIGLAIAAPIAPFVEGYRHPFTVTLSEPDAAAAGQSPHMDIRRGSGSLRFEARAHPFPIPESGPSTGFTDQVVFLEPRDLSWLARAAEPSSRLDGGIVITVERRTGEAAAALADAVVASSRLGAASLVVIRPDEAPSLLDRPGASKGSIPWPLRLPMPMLPPPLLVLTAGPELGAELLGPQRFARVAAEPLVEPEPGARPILLDLEMSVSAPLRPVETPMLNLIGWQEGTDPSMRSEAVLVTAPLDAPDAVSAMLETARILAEPANRPAGGILFAALDGASWGHAGARALAEGLTRTGVRVTGILSLEASGGTDPSAFGSMAESTGPATLLLIARSAGLVGARLEPVEVEEGDAFYFRIAGIRGVALGAPKGEETQRFARALAVAARALAD